jgi:hypothetical protein
MRRTDQRTRRFQPRGRDIHTSRWNSQVWWKSGRGSMLGPSCGITLGAGLRTFGPLALELPGLVEIGSREYAGQVPETQAWRGR